MGSSFRCFSCGDVVLVCFFFFSSRRRHTRLQGDWSSDVCSSDLPAAPSPVLPISVRGSETVLLVEDDEMIRALVQKVLKANGYTTLVAESGRSEEHTSELQSPCNLVCRLLLEKKNHNIIHQRVHT